MNAVKKLHFWADAHFFTWVDKRVSDQNEHRLHRRNLYTFPTPMGFAYLLLAVLIWLLGTNYQNNLILSLSYLQISLFVVAILHTYFNLAGVAIRFVGCEPVFAGEQQYFRFQVSTANKNGCEALECRWRDGPVATVQVDKGATVVLEVPLQSTRRGVQRPERLLIESRFPFGLIRCWSWLKFPAQGLVYPLPVEGEWPGSKESSDQEDGQHGARSGEDFYGFGEYQKGDSLKTVAWKHFARGRGLHSKRYVEPLNEDTWLRLKDFQHHGHLELALAQMTYWTLEMVRRARPFGLQLGSDEVPPGSGEAHGEQVLQRLALFRVEP